jgi:hypothetical protein
MQRGILAGVVERGSKLVLRTALLLPERGRYSYECQRGTPDERNHDMSIACGNRKAHASLIDYLASALQVRPARVTVHHATTDEVRRCFTTETGLLTLEDMDLQAEGEAEARAEAANERFWEDRGWAEARADEEMEARMGVIPFSEAWDIAGR